MPSRVTAAPTLCVVGARPNLMKIAAGIRAMRGIPELWDGRASKRIVAMLHEWPERSNERLVA